MPPSNPHLSRMDSPTEELATALKTLFELGKYSDLTITCGPSQYAVHKAIICSRSGFFDGACSVPFREAESGMIDLSEDDPDAVFHMIHYFYHLDYLTTPRIRTLSRGTFLKSPPASPRSQEPMSPMERNFRVSKKLNLSMVEDPLLAVAATNTPTNTGTSIPAPPLSPLSPPDAAAWFHGKHATTSLDAVMDEDEAEAYESESVSEEEANLSTSNLTLHAKVYAIAEKYGVQGLKTLSRKKFSTQMAYHWDSPEFPTAIQEAYETTVDSDRGLRDIVISTFRCYPELAQRRDVEAVVKETPELAWELFRVGWGLPLAMS